MEVKHTQGIGTTYLYQANIEEVGHGSEVRKGVVWQWREGGAYFGVLAQALLGKMSCWNDISPKRGKHELESPGNISPKRDKHKLESLGACYKSW